jgi:hypothetical protein
MELNGHLGNRFLFARSGGIYVSASGRDGIGSDDGGKEEECLACIIWCVGGWVGLDGIHYR